MPGTPEYYRKQPIREIILTLSDPSKALCFVHARRHLYKLNTAIFLSTNCGISLSLETIVTEIFCRVSELAKNIVGISLFQK